MTYPLLPLDQVHLIVQWLVFKQNHSTAPLRKMASRAKYRRSNDITPLIPGSIAKLLRLYALLYRMDTTSKNRCVCRGGGRGEEE